MAARVETGEQLHLRRSSLGWLVAQLGPHVVRLEGAPRGLDVTVGDPVIYDAQVRPAAEAGDLLLAIGVAPHGPDALELLGWAGSRGASAVAFKSNDATPATVQAAAEAAGVALLALPVEMAWDQFYVLVRRIVATSAEVAGDGDGPARGDVFALANVIAAMVGGSVKISDPRFEVIAYSNLDDSIDEARRHSILSRRPPDEMLRRLREDGTLGKLLRSPEAIQMPSWVGTKPRLGIAIRSGEEVLGFIFVAEGEEPMNEAARAALRQASRMAALHLLNLRSSDVIEERMRRDLLRGVLEGRGSVDLFAARLGIEASGDFTVIGFEPQPFGDEQGEDEGVRADDEDNSLRGVRIRDLVLLHAQALRRRAEAAAIGRAVYVLLPGKEPLAPERLVQLANDVLGSAQRALHVELRAGIGSSVGHLRDTARARQEADQVLHLLHTQLADRRVATFGQVRAHAFLLDLRQVTTLWPHVEAGKVAALLRHDAQHGTTYVATLRAYFDSLGDVNLAAQRVHVHRNTLRYRIRRLCELVALDLDDPTERLVSELELRLLEGDGALPGSGSGQA